jgi:hypothetical protein
MKPRTLYLLLCIVGIALPYWQFIPWLAANGMNFPLFFHELFANRISSFFGMDVLVSAVVLMIFVRREKLSGAARWLPLIAVLTVGVSLALPLFLYLRERTPSNATA